MKTNKTELASLFPALPKMKVKGKGRRKIPFERILDPGKRGITFAKRSKGVVKKLAELAVMCDAEFIVYVKYPSNENAYMGKSSNLKLSEFFQSLITNLPKINAKDNKTIDQN